MLKFSVGNKWTHSFLNSVKELNKLHEPNGHRVHELYGSMRSTEIGFNSARPDFRLPELDVDTFRDFVKAAHDQDIRINYTLNAPMHKPLCELHNEIPSLLRAVEKIIKLGVDIITLANSLFIEIINKNFSIPLEISSLMHAQSVAQIQVYKKWGVDQVCMDVTRNRDITFLSSFQKHSLKYGMETKLIVNEMCNVFGAPCSGIFQADCVIHSAQGGNPEGLFDNWPFSRCSNSRKDASSWLKSRFILPQWLDLYHEQTGISCFMITGRTCSESWLLNVINAYMDGLYRGDIRALWVDPGFANNTSAIPEEPGLMAEWLDKIKFINHWFEKPSFRCDERCGIDCYYCDNVALGSEEILHGLPSISDKGELRQLAINTTPL